MAASADGPFDDGLQLERTHLAWNRTAFTLGVNALLLVRFSRHVHPASLALVLAGAMALTALAAWWYGHAAYTGRSATLSAGRSVARPRVLRAFSHVMTALLFAAIVIALFAAR